MAVLYLDQKLPLSSVLARQASATLPLSAERIPMTKRTKTTTATTTTTMAITTTTTTMAITTTATEGIRTFQPPNPNKSLRWVRSQAAWDCSRSEGQRYIVA